MGSAWNEKKWVWTANGAILAGIAGYGTHLRWHHIDVSLYDNEIYARERAAETVGYIVQHSGAPLHDLLVKLSLQLGDTETALRLPGFLAGILTIFVLYALVCRLHSRTAGLVAAAVAAFNPYQIHLSQYASPEAVLVLCVLLAVWCLWTVLETQRWYAWAGFTVFSALALAPPANTLPVLLCMAAGGILYFLFNRHIGAAPWRVALAALLAVCTLAAPALLVQRGHDPRAHFEFHPGFGETATAAVQEERPKGGGRAVTSETADTPRYRVTHYDYVEYLKRYFWNTTAWMWIALLVVGVWGLADLCYRVPAAAAALAPGLLLGPAVLTLFTAPHPFHPRDFSHLSILAAVLIAIGICVLPRFLSRLLGAPRSLRLWRRIPAPAPTRTVTVANVLYPALILAAAVPLVPVLDRAYQTYPVYGYLPLHPTVENNAPVHDWKNLFESIAPMVSDRDVLVFMGPSHGLGPRYARYYLDRIHARSRKQDRPTVRFAAPSPELIGELARTHPDGNWWFVGSLRYRADDFAPLLEIAGAERQSYLARNEADGLRLFYVGAPATNLAHQADFEAGWNNDDLPEGVALDTRSPYAGRRAIRIAMPPPGQPDAPAERFVEIPRTLVGYRLRNNGFEAWKDGLPVAWLANEAAQTALQRDPEGFKGSTGLRLRPHDQTAILRQSIPVALAPGRELEVQAMGLATTPNNLHLVVRYSGPGFQEAHHIPHPGEGDNYHWYLMKDTIAIPEHADPASIALEIWRTPGGEGDVVVDNVELRVKEPGGRLDPDTTYVLSMMARTANLRDARDSTTAPVGRARLRWKTSGGEAGHFDVFSIRDHREWHRLYGVFKPGREIPADTEELTLEAGIAGGAGTLWIDNVQLEEGAYPTPYTRTFRLPHDERLGGMDLSPLVIAPSW